MSDDKTLERGLLLLHALYNRTKEGTVDWEPATMQGIFQAGFGAFRLRIRRVPDPDYPDQPDFALEVLGAESGQMVETISNITLRPLSDRTTDEGLNPYAVLKHLYDMARRKALRVDDALDSLLEALKSKP